MKVIYNQYVQYLTILRLWLSYELVSPERVYLKLLLKEVEKTMN